MAELSFLRNNKKNFDRETPENPEKEVEIDTLLNCNPPFYFYAHTFYRQQQQKE
jgi:hypothetical protein